MLDLQCQGRLSDGSPCSEIFHAGESQIGRSVRCPVCGTINKFVESSVPLRPIPHATVERVAPSAPADSKVTAMSRLRQGRKRNAVIASLGAALVAGIVLWIAYSLKKPSEIASGGLSSSSATSNPTGQPSAPDQTEGSSAAGSSSTGATPSQLSSGSRSNTLPLRADSGDGPFSPAVERIVPEVPSCARDQPIERLPTGATIEPARGAGPSDLTVDNGTATDAAIRLVNIDSAMTARFVYIKAHDSYTLVGIEPGRYWLRFGLGRQWVASCRDFLDASYNEFEMPLVFNDDTISVTLHAVPLGTARTRTIDRNRFFEGDHESGSAIGGSLQR